MQILSLRALNGPNVWNRRPVVEIRVDLSGWPKLDALASTAFWQQLGASLPHLTALPPPARVPGHKRRCVSDEPLETAPVGVGGFGAGPGDAAQALLEVTLALHALSRRPLDFGRVAETCEAEVYFLVFEYEELGLAQACLEFARELCEAAAQEATVNVASGLKRLRALADDLCLGTTTGALVAAARQRGIPLRRLDPVSLVQLGHGSRQRRLLTAITDQTGKIAEAISLDKDLTKALLREVGVPVPAGRPVRDREDAWRAACELGLPVVVKPRNGDYGLGVGLHLRTRDEILAAYDVARHYRDEVLVEQFVNGSQHRVTVVGQQMIAAVRRVPPQVTGDGVRSVTQLIEEANLDPRRGDDDFTPLNRICPDEDTRMLLAEQGLDLDSVSAAGAVVPLSRLAHTWAGGEVLDVTDLVHPEVAAQCVRAARTIGIDVAGLDLVAEDIRRPLEDQGGVVLEVNAGPAIALHFAPFCVTPRPVCEAILELLFPPGQTGRIPVVVVAGADDNVNTGRFLEQLLQGRGLRIGRTSSAGIHVGGCRIKAGHAANAAGARAVLLCPDVDLAILEQPWETIRAEGLCVEHCDVAVLAGPAATAWPGSRCSSESVRAARVLIESVGASGSLVIDANNAPLLSLAATHPGKRILVAAASEPSRAPARPGSPDLGYVGSRDGQLVLWSSAQGEQILRVARQRFAGDEPLTATGRGLLRAVAAAWACGASLAELQTELDRLRSGLPAVSARPQPNRRAGGVSPWMT